MSEERVEISTVQVQFSKAIIDRMKAHKITVDVMGTVYLILLALFEEKYDLLDVLDDDSKERRAGVLYRQLVLRGLLEPTTPVDDTFYRLTAKGNELVTFFKEQCKDQLPKNSEVHAEDLVTIVETEREDVEKWIGQYVNLFPLNNAEGRMLRTHEVTAGSKMKLFVKRYKYSKDVILAATELYLKEQEHNDSTHKYTKNSSNFIQKYGTGIESELASWCKRYLDTKNEPETRFDSSILDMA